MAGFESLLIERATESFFERTRVEQKPSENVYSKKIALAIDDLRPGTELTIYAPELFNVAEKNGLAPDKILDIDYGHRTVTIRVANENGKTYGYFSDLKQGSISLDSNTKSITLLS